MTLQTGSRAAVLRRSERARFRRRATRRRRVPGAIRSERSDEQLNTGSRAAVLRRSEGTFFVSSDDEVGGFRARSGASGASN